MLVFVVVLRQYLCQEARQHHATSDQCSKASHLPIVSCGSWCLAPMHHTPQEQIPCNRPSIFFPHVCSCASVSATLQWEKLHSSRGGARNVKSFAADRTAMTFGVINLGRWVGYLPIYFIDTVRCQRTPAPILLQSRVVLYFFRRSLGTLTLF